LSSYCTAPAGRARARYRLELAKQLNKTVTAMRVRVTRVRRDLDDCVKELSKSQW
jgi:ribosome recycling factor